MAKVASILGSVKGMARDFSLDQMPKGYVWDLVDYIPDIRGGQLESRAGWSYLTNASLAGSIWGGYDAVFDKGEKLLVCAGGNLYDQTRSTAGSAAAALVGSLFTSGLHNGRMFNDRVYFADGQGAQIPKVVTYNGTTISIASIASNAPKAKLLDIAKSRLIAAADPANPHRLNFAPTEFDGGPLANWDIALAWVDTSRPITALGVMSSVILVFHDGTTERIKGSLPPGKNVDTDMAVDTFSGQYGCVDPASVVPWQENLIFANSHGVHLTDGSTIRSLTDQGGIGEVWRHLYGLKRTGTQVSCGIYLNMLFCSILTQWDNTTPREDRSFTFVCDLATRAWYRITNVPASALIPSTTGVEQLWFGVDGLNMAAGYVNRLARIAPMFTGSLDMDPDAPIGGSYPDAVDGNAIPVLPRITTSYTKLGPEGQKRVRFVYVSHETQCQTPPTQDILKIGYRITPVILDSFVDIGGVPASIVYDRKRLPVGRPAYGIQVHVEQVLPSHISRLYDIGIEGWPQDLGKVS